MCAVSMVMEHYGDKWQRYLPYVPFGPSHPMWPRDLTGKPFPGEVVPPVSQDEINEFRQLLERARKYDREHNEPDCELEEKREKLRQLAKELGIEIGFIESPKAGA